MTVSEAFSAFGRWCTRRPLDAALLFGVLGTLIYFFGFYDYAMAGTKSTMVWASESWNNSNDLEHGWLIFPAAVVVAWFHRAELMALPKRGSWTGVLVVLFGILTFVVGIRTLQPRIAMVALPILIFGSTWLLWGWPVARKIAFACALLLFMVPVGFILNHTEPLQRLVAVVVQGLCSLFGIGIERDGVTLMAADGSFHCEVAGGCSGIRSLMAMTLLSAVYVHFTQDTLWKKLFVFACALPFAVIGNIARVFTIVLFSKFISVSIGTGPYHDISGFIVTIPIALFLMVQLGNLLNRDWSSLAARALQQVPPDGPATVAVKDPGQKAPSKSPISYDY
jgi:exosortase